MRILFVTASYLPTINGVTYHIADTKNALEKFGHQVLVLAPRYPGYKDTDPNIVRYPSLPNPIVPSYPIGLPFAPKTKIDIFRPQIIHTHHPFAVGHMAIKISRYYSAPLFFTAHTQYHAYVSHYFPFAKNLGSAFITRDLLSLSHSCQKVICPSPETAKRLSGLGITNTTIVPNGINNQIFHPGYKSLTIPPLRLIYVGRLNREKNLDFLLEVCKQLSQIKLDFVMNIIGSGNNKLNLSRQITALGLDQHVFLLGSITRENLPAYYRNAHLFITPSVTEVMPISILEALACGLPVIALKDSHLKSLLTHGVNGLLLPQNAEAIAKIISGLKSHPQKLIQMSRAAVKTARNFSLTASINRLAEIYASASSNLVKFPGARA